MQTLLQETVERDVIPALAKAAQKPKRVAAARLANEREVTAALKLSLGEDGSALAAYVGKLQAGGMAPDAIYETLLTPVARELGVMWEQDECSFADLTLAVLRLQNVQRDLSPLFRVGAARTAGSAGRILLMPVPGEQHVFGLSMVADHFTRAGWHAEVASPKSNRVAGQMLRAGKVDVLGLSLACDERLPDAARLIAALRKTVPGLRILVGGPSVVANPTLPGALGADAGAVDAARAVHEAQALLDGTAA